MDPTQIPPNEGMSYGSAVSDNMVGSPINSFGPSATPSLAMDAGLETGDIVLKPTNKKKTKIWWIIGLVTIIAALAIAATVIVATTVTKKPSVNAVKNNWNSYYNYLLFGPDGDTSTTVTVDDWYPEEMKSIDSMSVAEYNKHYGSYYVELKKRADVFYDNNNEVVTDAESYNTEVNAFINYNTINQLEEQVNEIYVKEGKDQATSFISNIINDNENNAELLCTLIGRYLSAYLGIIETHDKEGCYREGRILSNCPSSANDSNIARIKRNADAIRDEMNYYYNIIFEDKFFYNTQHLNSEIEKL